MRVCSLASGSSGNCFYVEDKSSKNAVLIDAGISAKKISERLSSINRDAKNIKGIFITHEHSDHIKGVDVFSRHHKIPIFATEKTIKNSELCSDSSLLNPIKNNECLFFEDLQVNAFSKSHQSIDPVSFSVSEKNKKISIITDSGYCCNNIHSNIQDSDFLCLESNHDIKMLEQGPYPTFLKQWIKSNTGHLSNMQAALAVLEYGNKNLNHIMLSHLSQTNNTPLLALHTFHNLIKERTDLKPKISVSPRERATELYNI